VRGQQSWNFVVSEAVCSTVVVRDNALKSNRITNRFMDPIDEIVNIVNASVASDEGTSEIVGEIATTGSDRFEEIMTMLRSVVMTMGSMDKRLNAIESSVVSLNRRMTPTRARTPAAIPNPDALKITQSPIFRTASTTTTDITARDHGREGDDSSVPATPVEMVRAPYFPMTLPPSSVPTRGVIKSHSAIADRGYTTKSSLWGSCLASLLVACMRRYILKTGESMHVIDESVLMSTYSPLPARGASCACQTTAVRLPASCSMPEL
jgi:hypothetical protein